MRLALLALTALTLNAATADTRKIEDRFFAPCCWHESLAVHDSPIAKELRAEVEMLTGAGKTEAEIVDVFVARYGERILQEPRGQRALILSALPWVALAAAGLGLAVYLRLALRARAAAQQSVASGPPIDDSEWDW